MVSQTSSTRNRNVNTIDRFFVESLENLQIFENKDNSFDAIVIDERNDQIIIGAK